jgi:hypothetical protein
MGLGSKRNHERLHTSKFSPSFLCGAVVRQYFSSRDPSPVRRGRLLHFHPVFRIHWSCNGPNAHTPTWFYRRCIALKHVGCFVSLSSFTCPPLPASTGLYRLVHYIGQAASSSPRYDEAAIDMTSSARKMAAIRWRTIFRILTIILGICCCGILFAVAMTGLSDISDDGYAASLGWVNSSDHQRYYIQTFHS